MLQFLDHPHYPTPNWKSERQGGFACERSHAARKDSFRSPATAGVRGQDSEPMSFCVVAAVVAAVCRRLVLSVTRRSRSCRARVCERSCTAGMDHSSGCRQRLKLSLTGIAQTCCFNSYPIRRSSASTRLSSARCCASISTRGIYKSFSASLMMIAPVMLSGNVYCN